MVPLLIQGLSDMKGYKDAINMPRKSWTGEPNVPRGKYYNSNALKPRHNNDLAFNKIKEFCSYPFYSLGVLANGDVTPCCTFYGTKLIIGNIHKQTLQEIWDGEKIKEFRKQIIFKEFNPICKKCLYSRDKNLFKKFGD